MRSIRLLLSALCTLPALVAVSGEIQFKNCEAPADIGNQGETGKFKNVCIRNHSFDNNDFAWDLSGTVVKNSNFTGCTFADNDIRTQTFAGTTWQNVRFDDCTFGSYNGLGRVTFEKTLLDTVVFSNCVFDESVDVRFDRFRMQGVLFENCTFNSKFEASAGEMDRVEFTGTKFGISSSGRNRGGDMKLRQLSVQSLLFGGSTINGTIRFEQAAVADFQIVDSEIRKLACHEEVAAGQRPSKTSDFNETSLNRVVFGGMSCEQTKFRGIVMRNMTVAHSLDLGRSQISSLVLRDVRAQSGTCTLNMDEARVSGKVISELECNASFRKTMFQAPISFDTSMTVMPYDFSSALFIQEYVNDECCTIACKTAGCKCAVDPSTASGECPVGDASVNALAQSSCFPGRALVSLDSAMGNANRMDALTYGQNLHTGAGTLPTPLILFGHRSSIPTSYLNLHTPGTTLTISPGHYLPINDCLATARTARINDTMTLASGLPTTIISITSSTHSGAYAPITVSGTLVVNDIRVSAYTDALHPHMAHALLAPIRALHATRFGQWVLPGVSVLHEWSGEPLARWLYFPKGPSRVQSAEHQKQWTKTFGSA